MGFFLPRVHPALTPCRGSTGTTSAWRPSPGTAATSQPFQQSQQLAAVPVSYLSENPAQTHG